MLRAWHHYGLMCLGGLERYAYPDHSGNLFALNHIDHDRRWNAMYACLQ